MRRAILAVLATAVGLVLLLSFKPHEMTALAQRPAAVGQGDPGETGESGGTGGSGGTGESGGSGAGAAGGFSGRDHDDEHDDEFDDDHDDDDGFDGGHRLGGGFPDSTGSSGTSGPAGSSGTSSGAWSGPGATAGATSGEKTVTGDSADTRWGPVRVAIVISGGRMAGIKVLDAPASNRRDVAINNEALPILNEEALSAQSAEIDTVSGATYTSEGYIRSLQSALDQAGL